MARSTGRTLPPTDSTLTIPKPALLSSRKPGRGVRRGGAGVGYGPTVAVNEAAVSTITVQYAVHTMMPDGGNAWTS